MLAQGLCGAQLRRCPLSALCRALLRLPQGLRGALVSRIVNDVGLTVNDVCPGGRFALSFQTCGLGERTALTTTGTWSPPP